MQSIKRTFFIAVLLLIIVFGLYALSSLESLRPSIANQEISPLPKAKTTIWIQNEGGDTEQRLGTISSTYDANTKTWTISTADEVTKSVLRITSIGELLAYQMLTKDESQIKRNKYDQVSIQKAANNQYVFIKSLADKKEAAAVHNLSPSEILIAVLPYQAQQLLKAKIKDGVNLNLVITNNFSFNFDLKFMLIDPSKNLGNNYTFPKAFSDSLKKYASLHVVETGVTGIASVIYPHKFYLAFGPAPDFLPVGAWGGEPGKDFFQINEVF